MLSLQPQMVFLIQQYIIIVASIICLFINCNMNFYTAFRAEKFISINQTIRDNVLPSQCSKAKPQATDRSISGRLYAGGLKSTLKKTIQHFVKAHNAIIEFFVP